MIRFEEEIKKYRIERKWTKVVMAKFLYGVSYPTYVRWESGKLPDRWVQCLVLEKLLGRPIGKYELPDAKGRGPCSKND